MKVSYEKQLLDIIPAERIVYLPKYKKCKALICPKTYDYRLQIDEEDVDYWFEQQGITEKDYVLVRNYDLGLYHDDPVLIFDREADAVLFALRWL